MSYFSADIIDMKKKYLFLVILFVSVAMPFQLLAQSQDVFKQEGIASWYGREFEGRPTASGEIFDSSQLTAAHPSLPFGTRLIITNQHNNKSVTVRVNDRGPFVPARIIDVSRAAAEQLDMIVTGTAPVSVVSIDRMVITSAAVGAQMSSQATATPTTTAAPVRVAPQPMPQLSEQNVLPLAVPAHPMHPTYQAQPTQPVQSAQQQNAAPSASVFVSQPVIMHVPTQPIRLTPNMIIDPAKNYRLQVGSFRNARNAVETFDKLKASGLNPAYERFSSDNVDYYRVVLAGIRGTDVESTAERLSFAGFREAIIREEN